ncbi:hypothetical protein G7046_g9557 [Stylonectria norvegica]|nr:hypothetical protein G7046_g9557 [Stylonectria norvegica]
MPFQYFQFPTQAQEASTSHAGAHPPQQHNMGIARMDSRMFLSVCCIDDKMRCLSNRPETKTPWCGDYRIRPNHQSTKYVLVCTVHVPIPPISNLAPSERPWASYFFFTRFALPTGYLPGVIPIVMARRFPSWQPRLLHGGTTSFPSKRAGGLSEMALPIHCTWQNTTPVRLSARHHETGPRSPSSPGPGRLTRPLALRRALQLLISFRPVGQQLELSLCWYRRESRKPELVIQRPYRG